MNRNYLYCTGSIFFILLLFSGCHFFIETRDTEVFTINLPHWPPENGPEYPELSRWKIIIDEPDSSVSFYTTAKSFPYNFQKNETTSITAYPITRLSDEKETLYFHPSGLVYPYSEISNHNLYASWYDGYISESIHRIISSKKESGITDEHLKSFLQTYNWKKALELIRKKINESKSNEEEACFNPWQIDSERFLENLCYGNFKTSFFNISDIYTFSIQQLFPQEDFSPVSPFIPENEELSQKQVIALKKNNINFLGNGFDSGFIIICKSAKNISKEYIHMPIYIEDI